MKWSHPVISWESWGRTGRALSHLGHLRKSGSELSSNIWGKGGDFWLASSSNTKEWEQRTQVKLNIFCEEKQNFSFGLISSKISVRFHSEKSLQHLLAWHQDVCCIQPWILMLHVKMCNLNNQFYFTSVSRWSLGIIFLLYKYFCF